MSQTFEFLPQAKNLSAQRAGENSTPWLASLRENGVNAFSTAPWPGKKTEHWKYTSLHALTLQDFNKSQGLQAPENVEWEIPDLNPIQLVFINGVFSSALSSSLEGLEDGLDVVRFADATQAQQAVIKQHLGNIVSNSDKHLFAALNNGMIDDGVFIHVAKNQIIQRPIQLVHCNTANEQAFTTVSRLLIVVEQGAEATVVEHFTAEKSGNTGLTNALTEIQIEANAKLYHYRLNLEPELAMHIGGLHINLQRDSQLESFQLGLGGALKRIDLVVNHNEPGAHCELKGVYLPRNKEHIDYHTSIEHRAPHCTTNEVFRGIIADRAKAVFNGRIHIHPDAQKTLAELSNKNLLLSNQAEINTKPELEIYADDVRCAHGATVSQLDDKALYYLMSRGISRQEAEVMLSFGFINTLLEEVRHEPIQDKLRPLLARLFGNDPELLRHIV